MVNVAQDVVELEVIVVPNCFRLPREDRNSSELLSMLSLFCQWGPVSTCQHLYATVAIHVLRPSSGAWYHYLSHTPPGATTPLGGTHIVDDMSLSTPRCVCAN